MSAHGTGGAGKSSRSQQGDQQEKTFHVGNRVVARRKAFQQCRSTHRWR